MKLRLRLRSFLILIAAWGTKRRRLPALRLRLRSFLILIAVLALCLEAEVARRRAIESENISFFYERLERGASLDLQVAHAAIEYSKSMVKQKPGDTRWPKHEALWRKTADDANRRAIRFRNLRIKYHSERFHVWKSLVIPPPSEMTPILTPGDYPPDLEDIQ